MHVAVVGIISSMVVIAYEYWKLTMRTMIKEGCDGNLQEMLDTYSKISDNDSILLKVYFYYLQLQRLMFCGCFTSLGEFVESGKEDYKYDLMSSSERKDYQQKASPLMIVWSWNGVDLPLFLLVLMSLFGVVERCLFPLVCLLALQFVLTIIYHQTQTQRLLNVGKVKSI